MSALTFDKTHLFQGNSQVITCLSIWSKVLPNLGGFSDENGSLCLRFGTFNGPKIVHLTNCVATHTFKRLFEVTSSGVPEIAKHYQLSLGGMCTKTTHIMLVATLIIDEPGKEFPNNCGKTSIYITSHTNRFVRSRSASTLSDAEG